MQLFNVLPTNPREMRDAVLRTSIAALKMNRFTDNYDARRFNIDGKDHSGDFLTSKYAFFFEWFIIYTQQLFDAYNCLKDDASKRLYLNIIAYKMTGHFSIKLPVPFADKKKELQEYHRLENPTDSSLTVTGMLGKLKHYDFSFKGQRYIADCFGFDAYLFNGQYFYNRDGVTVAPEPGDYVIDGGACTGDTAQVFSNAVGPEGRVYAFDPVANNLEIMLHNINQFPIKNIRAMPYGLSNKNVDADPIVLRGYSPAFNVHEQKVPLRSIDHLVASQEIEKVNVIKLDIEGSEMEALQGADATIRKFHPKLEVSLYHKPNDLFELVLYLRQKYPFYTMYLDHYTIHDEETVLYCVAK